MFYLQMAAASYVVAFVLFECHATIRAARIVGWPAIAGLLGGWRVYTNALLLIGVGGFAAQFPIGNRLIWAFGALLAAAVLAYDLLQYPGEISDEEYVDEAFLKKVRSQAWWGIPLIGFNAAYAVQTKVWTGGA